MLSWDATLSPGPCGPAKFWDFRCQKVKIFEKIARCARKEYTKRDRYQESALDNAKSEDPAKMTHSIPDFASRNAINTPIFIPILAVLAVNHDRRESGPEEDFFFVQLSLATNVRPSVRASPAKVLFEFSNVVVVRI